MLRAVVAASFCSAIALAQTNFPPPPAPANNPPNPQKVLLGMALFFEEQLSSTGTVACASCHDFASGGGDPRALTAHHPGHDGVFGTADDKRGSPGVATIQANGTVTPNQHHGFGPNVTPRRAPTVVNSGYHTLLAYDGSRTSLEALIAVPPLNTVEMGHAGRTWNDVAQKIANATPLLFASDLPARLQTFVAGRTYPQLFQLAFGATTVNQTTIVQAIASYLRTLNSDRSRWDLFLHGLVQLTAEEQLGFQLFTTPANGATSCRTCHNDFDQSVLVEGPVVGQMTMTTVGYYGSPQPTRLLFHNIGLRPPVEDPGRQGVSGLPIDAGKFRVASLRNVELSAPYFHNGSASTLRDVLDFYDRGGDFHFNQAPSLTPRGYTDEEKDAIVALLKMLTDPRLAAGVLPFDRPTLGAMNFRHATPVGQSDVTAAGTLVAQAPFAPRLGEAWFRLTLTGATPGVPTFLMWDTAIGPGTAPFNIGLGLTPAFQMFATGLAQGAPTMNTGFAQVPVPLPANPALSGQHLYAQWLVLEPSAQWPFASSNGLYIPLR